MKIIFINYIIRYNWLWVIFLWNIFLTIFMKDMSIFQPLFLYVKYMASFFREIYSFVDFYFIILGIIENFDLYLIKIS